MVSGNINSVKRFGSRYGRTVRHKVGKIENMQKSKHMCPYCRKIKAKRISAGIWQCSSCDAKFTSKAYSVDVIKKVKKVSAEDLEVKEKVKSSGSKYSEKSLDQSDNSNNLQDDFDLEKDNSLDQNENMDNDVDNEVNNEVNNEDLDQNKDKN